MEGSSNRGRLHARVAIVTGAGRGIGRAIALTLADHGASVTVAARSADEIAETARLIEDAGGQAAAITTDVTNEDDVRRLVAESERLLGPTDILCNNAGIAGPREPLWEVTAADSWRPFEVNVLGPILTSHAMLPGMIARRRGVIINVGSYLGIRPSATYMAYAASKAALVRLGDSLATAVEPYDIRVFTLSPGAVRTAMTDAIPEYNDFPEDLWSPPERCAAIVARLARGDADALSGSFLHVTDDLDRLIAEAGRIQSEGLYTLRLLGLDGPVP